TGGIKLQHGPRTEHVGLIRHEAKRHDLLWEKSQARCPQTVRIDGSANDADRNVRTYRLDKVKIQDSGASQNTGGRNMLGNDDLIDSPSLTAEPLRKVA